MTARPFMGTEALAAGAVTRRTLASRHQMIYRNVYVPDGHELTAATRAEAAWLWARRDATVAGLSAAALYGSKWIDPALPAELIRSVPSDVGGIVIHRDTLDEDEVRMVTGVRVTTPARTGFDIGRRGTLTEAVIRLDALANAADLEPAQLAAVIDRHRGARGSQDCARPSR